MLQPNLSRVSGRAAPSAAPHRMVAVWLTPLVSSLICLTYLFFAYRQIFRLWRDMLTTRWKPLAFVLLPMVVSVACLPIVNRLDRIIHVNW